MVFGEECFTSTRVNHILRVTKPILNELRIFVPIRYPELGHGVCVVPALQITSPSTTS
jgi:hypothetical protein